MYTKYYGLIQKPFENTPDSHFLFLSKQHREVLASLEYGIDAAKGFILVAGDIGTGKTTLVNALMQQLDETHIVINIINPRSSFNDILAYLAGKLGVSGEVRNSLDLIEAMRGVLETLASENRRVVLIIDEAHLLSDTALEDIRLLSNIECEDRKLIQIVLVGQNEIHRKLERPALQPLKQRLVIMRRLCPLTKKEAREYIYHRVQVAGRKETLFDEPAIRKIYRKSMGTPRLINQICDNAMLIGFALEAPVIGVPIIREVIGDMAVDARGGANMLRQVPRSLKMVGAAAAVFVFIVCATLIIISGDSVLSGIPGTAPPLMRQPRSTETTPLENPVSSGSIFPPVRTAAQEETPVVTGSETDGLLAQASAQANSNRPAEGKAPILSITEDETAVNGRATEKVHDTLGGDAHNPRSSDLNMTVRDARLQVSALVLPKCERASKRNGLKNKEKEVLPNDWLRKIALREYGLKTDTIIDMVHMANPGIEDVNRIFPGQRLVLPVIEKEDLVASDDQGNFHIHFASFYNLKAANQALQELIRKQEKGFMIPCRQNQNNVYRVYIGAFDTRKKAIQIINTLKLKHIFLDKKDGSE